MLLSYSEERVEYEHVPLYHGHDLVQGFRSGVAQLRVVQHDPPALFRAARHQQVPLPKGAYIFRELHFHVKASLFHVPILYQRNTA